VADIQRGLTKAEVEAEVLPSQEEELEEVAVEHALSLEEEEEGEMVEVEELSL
jgi:hypothetical protein